MLHPPDVVEKYAADATAASCRQNLLSQRMAAAIQSYFIVQNLLSLTAVEQRQMDDEQYAMATQSIEPEEHRQPGT